MRGRSLRVWIEVPGHVGRAFGDGRLPGWGVIRQCRTGHKVGLLIADDRAAAEAVFAALVGSAGGQVFLDGPQPNAAAVALATAQSICTSFRDRVDVFRSDPEDRTGAGVRRDHVRNGMKHAFIVGRSLAARKTMTGSINDG